MDLSALDIARWQFAITTVYHFLFVPITIGLSAIVAGYQTAWVRTGNEQWLRLTKFFGKLFLINFAIGVVTGIVQEFQFGMNWSDYSRFVGDIFGAPLAVEGLLAFFLESTFLGLWIFGWDRLPKKAHLATIWLAHIGTVFSAYFILAANSFMQHPVGYEYNPETGRAELTDFFAVLTNKVQLVTFPHVLLSAYMTAAGFVVGVSVWQMIKGARRHEASERSLYKAGAKTAAWVLLIASAGVIWSGDAQAKVMTEVQPMKMAAAEALYDTEPSAPFSLFTIGSLDGSEEKFAVTVPNLLSFLATGTFDGTVQGINELSEQYTTEFGSDPSSVTYASDYTPIEAVTYWSFRLMMGLGFAGIIAAIATLVALRGDRNLADTKRPALWLLAAWVLPLGPLFANSFGWIFTEVGRQPWAVFGLMTVENAVSPTVSAFEVLTSLIVFTLLYGVLAVVEIKLMLSYIKKGADDFAEPVVRDDDNDPDRPLAFAY
ncbi:cytochrome ubiquinol oxidase subunit I [Nocardioides sp. GY 10127]|uniref:cytochrome ubiquinol oxidase subunit I n=1 Tax=Nocardioides sp. GY 10127 TaxID=2569762 RepID=UPI0010A84438|nr:cytochrome ubiquinol oxidase subunit I [Nocardioides sp. GY 10127]TIC81820.1 cytochrome ubiquinol oxidase subunit I [Nocardioides sp. GY 10127]